jgi:hypothetical protein
MSATPAAPIPLWATATTVTSGPDTGLATRLEPAAAIRAAGYVGGQPIPARIDNARAGAVGDWLAHLAPIQMRNWRRDVAQLYVTGYTSPRLSPCAVAIPSGWIIPGSDGGIDDKATIYWHPAPGSAVGEATSASRIQVTGACMYLTAAYDPTSGVVLLGELPNATPGNLCVTRMGEGGVGLTRRVLSATPGGAGRVVWAGVAGRFLAFDHRDDGWQTGKLYWVTEDGGITWTSRTISGTATGHDILCVEQYGGEIIVTRADQNGIMNSTDGGETWILHGTAGGAAGVTGLCHTGNGWMCIDEGGQVYRRFGDLWLPAGVPLVGTHFGQSSLVSHDGQRYYGSNMASDGSRTVVVPFIIADRGHGVYWTQDYGVTWHAEWLSQTLSTIHSHVTGIRYGNGEFLLITQVPNVDNNTVVIEIWRSLRL